MAKQTAGRRFRATLSADFEPPDAVQSAVLDQMCALLDDLEGMERVLSRDGLTTVGGNGQTTAHPLLAAKRQHSLAVARLAASLGLEQESQRTHAARNAANARWTK